MQRLRRAALLVAVTGMAFAAAAAEPAPDTRCGAAPIVSCLTMRVEALDRLASELDRAAAMTPPRNLSKADRAELAEYDAWLKATSARARELARAGRQALAAGQSQALTETQMSFNLLYLQLQSQMQHENRSYTAISNIMKTKHDTAKNSISNVR